MPAVLQMPVQTRQKMTPRSLIGAGQLQFDWLLGERQFWSLKSAAGLLGLSDSFLEKLWDQGQIAGHEFNAGRGERLTKRIPRAFVVALLVRSANYSSEAKLQTYMSCLREFGEIELQQLVREAEAEIKQRAKT